MYAFVPRTEQVVTRDDWDTLGMRGSQSRTTELHGVVAPADRVVRSVAPGPNPDPIVFGIFSVFEVLLASVYTGIARRALDVAVETVQAHAAPEVGHHIQPRPRHPLAHRRHGAGLRRPSHADRDHRARRGRRRGSGGVLVLLTVRVGKHRAVVMSKHVVDDAMLVAGGSSYFTRNELSRLYRDVLAGMFTPATLNRHTATRPPYGWDRSRRKPWSLG